MMSRYAKCLKMHSVISYCVKYLKPRIFYKFGAFLTVNNKRGEGNKWKSII
ncbi:hypothetical protein BSUA_02498 [Bacillus subtilis subsp. subtilis str. JH642 substr. AG174]|uniref:Uncharacterized protein YpuE n=1 Tax=Bacillus subtilis (strain 168) TaxID=224308 RepID=YPUE_BACSU|nr:RecName: Full=Uncharacterized protein YpuE; AltName: Full=ORFX5 [Bacillus subtilis subsp. subtilis str. 168]AAA67480.1 ORFX5 [Bacillus subtilis subsp. subtilis str. 168]AIC40777.1 hypothetical protein BSUA_02498 [Bacillus subtilis subsp. subtilis str. JH642 substr. AG174]AIC45009.1 hypothetical protein BSUB_02498 [Bacillus subtilis subsp. subtilis str. AG1839]